MPLLNTKETAAYVRLGKPTLERFRLTGEGPSYLKLGGAVRYRKEDLDTWLESRLMRSTSDTPAAARPAAARAASERQHAA